METTLIILAAGKNFRDNYQDKFFLINHVI